MPDIDTMQRPLYWMAHVITVVAIAINVWAITLDLRRDDWDAASWQVFPLLFVSAIGWGFAVADQLRAERVAVLRIDRDFKQTMLEKLRAAQDLSISGAVDVDDDETQTH